MLINQLFSGVLLYEDIKKRNSVEKEAPTKEKMIHHFYFDFILHGAPLFLRTTGYLQDVSVSSGQKHWTHPSLLKAIIYTLGLYFVTSYSLLIHSSMAASIIILPEPLSLKSSTATMSIQVIPEEDSKVELKGHRFTRGNT